MPEILEIEMYRRAAHRVVGRTIEGVTARDSWYLKETDAPTVTDALVGATVTGCRRHGKLLLLDTTHVVVGLRFGMTGRLVVDGEPVIERLEYSSARLDASWDRFALAFDGKGSLVMNDPRRLGGVLLDPDTAKLGPDAWSVAHRELDTILSQRTTALKALLLDQKRIAGLGNLLVDELLWRVGLAPTRGAAQVSTAERERLAATLGPMLDELYDQGGSHKGDLVAERHPQGQCPRDGVPLRHDTVGGRSTWWCPAHQL